MVEFELIDTGYMMETTKVSRKPSGRLTFSVYHEVTHTDQYLQYSSNQPLQHKLGVIRTLYHRGNLICLDDTTKLAEIEHLKAVLSISGYTKAAWVTATNPKNLQPPEILLRRRTRSKAASLYLM